MVDPRRRKEWKQAEWAYETLLAQSMLPGFGGRLTSSELADRLQEIVEICPAFYPAQLDLGVRMLAKGGDRRAEERILSALQTILEVEDSGEVEEPILCLTDNLERMWRYDLCKRVFRRMVKRYPENAAFHDGLAHAAARLGEMEVALRHSSRAVASRPDSAPFRSNLGWFLLMAGRVEEATRILEEARVLDPEDAVIRGNLEIHRYLLARGGNYLDFLLRPADRPELDRLADADRWEELNALCDSYNRGRIEAMAQCRLREGGRRLGSLSDTVATLAVFFRFLEGLVQAPYFLYEDLAFVERHFKPIMHKFIFKHGDVDRDMIEDINEVLFEFYGFLAGRKLVSGSNLASFRKTSLALKSRLMAKMTKYNKVRHAEGVAEEEKEALREEIFEGDAFWPHL